MARRIVGGVVVLALVGFVAYGLRPGTSADQVGTIRGVPVYEVNRGEMGAIEGAAPFRAVALIEGSGIVVAYSTGVGSCEQVPVVASLSGARRREPNLALGLEPRGAGRGWIRQLFATDACDDIGVVRWALLPVELPVGAPLCNADPDQACFTVEAVELD